MTADEYYALASTFDQRREEEIEQQINNEIDRIPLNINRSGKTFIKRCKSIRQKNYDTRKYRSN